VFKKVILLYLLPRLYGPGREERGLGRDFVIHDTRMLYVHYTYYDATVICLTIIFEEWDPKVARE